ncbi:MAG: hypothetical protein IKI95_08520 [Clostridia bacterium]|nr:hypothetical protein [Clostridia bacterium]
MAPKKCPCGGTIVFESKKTFTDPEETNGICVKCRKQYKLVGNKLIGKEKK